MNVDMEQVTAQTVQQLGAQIGMLTLQLAAEQAASRALMERVAELEQTTEEKP